MVYLPLLMVDFYGFHVGKSTSPMDPMGSYNGYNYNSHETTSTIASTTALADPRLPWTYPHNVGPVDYHHPRRR